METWQEIFSACTDIAWFDKVLVIGEEKVGRRKKASVLDSQHIVSAAWNR